MKLIKITAIWCMSCILMNEILKNIEATNHKHYETINYDYDTNQADIEAYEVGTVLPVYILLDRDDHEIARLIGEKTQKELTAFLLEGGAISEENH